jgi:HK97 gp10 family phage protein
MARVVLHEAAIADLARDPAVLRAVGEVAEQVASRMRATAPKRTGAAAASIRSEPAPDPADGFRVSWDRDHFYLGFSESGTVHQRPRPFVERAAESVGR